MKLERTPVVDQYDEAGEAAIMLPDGRVLAVSELIVELLRLIESGLSTSEELEIALVQTFGAPDGSENQRDIDAIVQFVLAQGLVQVAQH